jgi:hypothetical protein
MLPDLGLDARLVIHRGPLVPSGKEDIVFDLQAPECIIQQIQLLIDG